MCGKRKFYIPVLLVCQLVQTIAQGLPTDLPPLTGCRQLVLVVSPNDTSVHARLACYSLEGQGWASAGIRTPVVLGRTGLAWGAGKHPVVAGRKKAEGDGKSPAGVFALGPVFGRAADGQRRFRMPYLPLTEQLECVDDPASGHYNRLVSRGAVTPDWNSSEHMAAVGPQYDWGLFVHHNVPASPSGGSCIFLHVWGGATEPTAGCTAMPEDDLLALLEWLDPDQSPRLVQLTEESYARFREEWSLPPIP
ncbi:MAG: hypothetical protein RLY31_1978 [Bacteroidota bacterium]|jgi:D-alanyl-D-alanine dipeptidase